MHIPLIPLALRQMQDCLRLEVGLIDRVFQVSHGYIERSFIKNKNRGLGV